MDRYLCLRTGTVISQREVRRTRIKLFHLGNDPDTYSEKVYALGEFRRIHSVEKPEGDWSLGYEERPDGKLYQKWIPAIIPEASPKNDNAGNARGEPCALCGAISKPDAIEGLF
jgi:hypothetical protein